MVALRSYLSLARRDRNCASRSREGKAAVSTRAGLPPASLRILPFGPSGVWKPPMLSPPIIAVHTLLPLASFSFPIPHAPKSALSTPGFGSAL
jgi:hypothetical protein